MIESRMDNIPEMGFFEELMSYAEHDDAGSRLRAASMIMERCGDPEVADTLRTLSAQTDFDDNEEASPAIERTRTKLDSLIADRRSHESMGYIRMLRDSEILEISGGEVVDGDYDELGSCFCKKGLFDPDIFGGSGKIPLYDDKNDKLPVSSFGQGFGHIQMPVCTVLEEDYHLIARLLGMSADDVHCVAKYAKYLVMEPGESGLKKHAVLNEKEYNDHSGDKDLVVSIGGNAIHDALKGLGYGDEPERLAFSVIPVCSPMVRPIAYSKEEGSYYNSPLNERYSSVVFKANRCRKLMELGAPEIIIRNESRMLDDAVNKLINTARETIRQTHWNKSKMHGFMYTQLKLILRERNFALRALTEEELNKTSDIESLELYPEEILLCDGSGKTEKIELRKVTEHNASAISSFQQENMVILPGDADEDSLDEETRAEIDRIDAISERMRNNDYDVLAAARNQREKCMVRYDETDGMYVPVSA